MIGVGSPEPTTVDKQQADLEKELRQTAVLPEKRLPIVSIGLGGIVHDAHYPAYKIAGFEVAGAFDTNEERAKMMQEKFGIPLLYTSVEDLVERAPQDAIIDIAVHGDKVLGLLKQLPDNRAVLIQKPLGEDLETSRAIRDLCRSKNLIAAVNFQMRYVPHIIALRDMINKGLLGEVYDMEVRMQINTPWHLWSWLEDKPRMEILYHSIHYIDLCRSFFGNPQSVYAKTLPHPQQPGIKGGARTTMILDYGDSPRVNIMTNHSHAYGSEQEQSYVKVEGEKGAVYIQVGLNMDYPRGAGDFFNYCLVPKNGKGEKAGAGLHWEALPVKGSWFPEAFIGTMASLMRKAVGETDVLPTSVEDAHFTMATVEAAYISSLAGGTPLPE